MADGNSLKESEKEAQFSLRRVITSTREFLDRTISTGKTHSPFAQDKLDAADDTIEALIHNGYQAVKRITVNGHPAVILSVAAIAVAGPSIPFGPRVIVRNAGLATVLASVMIYPDHLRNYIANSSQGKGEN